jgi:hypothetical protein
MQFGCKCVFTIILCCAAAARIAAAPVRPDVNTGQPIVKCKLQSLGSNAPTRPMPLAANIYAIPTPVDDPLANYERTELGNWRMPGDAALADPWLRLLVIGPKRPVVVDVAVIIDGKTFRQAREAWIDELLTAPADKPSANPATEPAESSAGNKSEDLDGTEAKDTASNDKGEIAEADTAKVDEEPEVKDEGKEDDEAETKIPGVTTQSRQLPMMRERLANYLAASGAKVERDEIGWLVAEWGSGPGLIVLDAAHSWQRAGVAMLEAQLDGDGDGMLSEKEISGADQTLQSADLDANDVVEASELRRANHRESNLPLKMGNSLVVILDSNTDWNALANILSSVYESSTSSASAVDPASPIQERIARGDSALTEDALHSLIDAPADVSLRVDFGGSAGEAGGLSLIAASPDLIDKKDAVTTTDTVITVDLGSDYLEFSAAGSSGANAEKSESQIAVGAVIDGNPLLRILDQDQDQRLTLRERQELKGLLTSLDRDSDGKLATAEIPLPIRLAITLGPHVHELLAEPTGAARPVAPSGAPAPPDWFASMDKNNDRDLSREEFLGTSDQFKQADADGDGLLNVVEALKLSGGK